MQDKLEHKIRLQFTSLFQISNNLPSMSLKTPGCFMNVADGLRKMPSLNPRPVL